MDYVMVIQPSDIFGALVWIIVIAAVLLVWFKG